MHLVNIDTPVVTKGVLKNLSVCSQSCPPKNRLRMVSKVRNVWLGVFSAFWGWLPPPRIDRDPGKIPVPVKISLFAGIPVPVEIMKLTGISTGISISNF